MSSPATTPAAAEAVLTVDCVAAGYGGIEVLSEVDLTVPPSSVVALLGPNGAGKTTLLRAVAGTVPVRAGHIALDGIDVSALRPFRRQQRGLCFIPEGRGVFRSLTVRENICVQVKRADRARAVERSVEAFPALGRRLRQTAGTLSGGEQQMLALARCYIQDPSVILVDEVSMGLAPIVIDDVFASLAVLRDSGVSIVLVEQYVDRALDFADAVYTMTRGKVRYAGAPADIDRAQLMSGYLGAHHEILETPRLERPQTRQVPDTHRLRRETYE